jgi:RHS repeat-associated protein
VVGGALVRGWLYGKDSLRPIAQLDASGQIQATFVYATHANVPDTIVLRSGAVYRVLTDHLGSVRLVVDVATGGVVQRLDYDEFGIVTADTDPGFQPFGFAGGLYDADTGLVRFGVRDYDAVSGRWTAKDPALFVDGTNLYAYVGNDPINFIDPTGLDGWWFPSRDDHCKRNTRNQCPAREPNNICEEQDFWFDGDHGNKYRSPDGSECAYDANGDLIDDGSYNFTPDYRPEYTSEGYYQHIWQDVLPWALYGDECHQGQTTAY